MNVSLSLTLTPALSRCINQQKTHALAVNGEIYNHQALRAEYGDRYAFQTGSDCEVILALYQEKGPAFLDDLQGMFAFALYDSEQDAYLIGRDHIGIIPLYMGHDEHGNFYVASEMKALVPVCRTLKSSRPAATCGAKMAKSASITSATGLITTR
ncbi:Asparagine synthetase B [glutamine-hydrolyzing] [Raoultella terrigena]|uniref:Asparagine synthetase B [glutamine-hydrolyzing] n=1 Tax=Raoultella terrigena TaxID=577 RepID=A0A485B516_RAOTE|nr:Asparagine synthetase B [glutamine-hydrolyzing] [Raoultella terrigena]